MQIQVSFADSTCRGLCRSRRGASAVEFAFLAPFLAMLTLGMLELGRALNVKEMLSSAAQSACRTATLPGTSNTDVLARVAKVMADNHITNYTVTIRVNGVVADVSTAKDFKSVSVQIAVPITQVLWTTKLFLSGQNIVSEEVVMMRMEPK